MVADDVLLKLQGVSRTYQMGKVEVRALQNVDLKIRKGEFIVILGPSGSGKTTLLNLIGGIDSPTAGRILADGVDITSLDEKGLTNYRREHIGFIFQFFNLIPSLTARENVEFAAELVAKPMDPLEMLDIVGLKDRADHYPSELSGGEQQRVAIARALANDPPIVVADEPTGNLDSKTAEAVFKLFDSLVAQSKTVLMVTHDRDLAKRVSRTLILSDGEIIEEYLARTFPTLTEEQVIRATRDVQAQRYAPGTVILEEGDPPDRLYIITKGQVDVVLNGNSDQEMISTALNAGQYFGEVELLRGGHNIATIRADRDTGAEVAALNRTLFDSLLAETASLRQELDRLVALRVAENQSTRRTAYCA